MDITHWISHTRPHKLDITHWISHTHITHSTSYTLHNGVRGERERLCKAPHTFPALHLTFNAFNVLNGLFFYGLKSNGLENLTD